MSRTRPRSRHDPQRRHRDGPGRPRVFASAGDSHSVAVLAALSANPGGATVAVIAGYPEPGSQRGAADTEPTAGTTRPRPPSQASDRLLWL